MNKILMEYQLEMAAALLKICESNKIKIFAGYGTLLGCVRHKGYIPWDDDMDFVMLREDYDRLKEFAIGNSNINSKIYFDLNRPDIIKLRYSGTSMREPNHKLLDSVDQSVWIDVFCLDTIPNNSDELKAIYIKLRQLLKPIKNSRGLSFGGLQRTTSKIYHIYAVFFTMLLSLLFGGRKKLSLLINNMARKSNNKSNHRVANIMEDASKFPYKSHKLIIYEKKWYNETIFLPFESIELPCPKNYHEVLTADFGEYMTPVKAPATHGGVEIDVHRSYKEINREKLKQLPWFKRFLYRF